MVQTVQNEKDGKVAFAAIDYATPGDHDYTIKGGEGRRLDRRLRREGREGPRQRSPTKRGAEGDRHLTVKAVPTFTNTKPTADVTVEATKVLAGKDLTADAFTFGLVRPGRQ